MRIAVTGSVATDHLMTFSGRFSEQVLPEQIGSLSLSFLASDLQVRRGGTAANIAFGMAVLGARPLLVGSVGRDAAEYVGDLAAAGVDTSGVRTSATLATARFTCTTDLDHNQIGTFYPGAMAEAAEIELAALGPLDLVVVAPNDPGAMLRHTDECRPSGTPFAADPSQQLAFLDGGSVRRLVDGAAYLFTNEYEAGLVRDKTGWSDDEVLERVGTRVTTHGAQGVRITRRGEAEVHVPVRRGARGRRAHRRRRRLPRRLPHRHRVGPRARARRPGRCAARHPRRRDGRHPGVRPHPRRVRRPARRGLRRRRGGEVRPHLVGG